MPRDEREIAHRTSEARRLLDEPLLNEAFDRIERQTIDSLLQLKRSDDDERWKLVCYLQVVRSMRGHLKAIVVNGDTVLAPRRAVV